MEFRRAGFGVIPLAAARNGNRSRARADDQFIANAAFSVSAKLPGKVQRLLYPLALGPSLGFLPQDVALFRGTVAENISRFAPIANSERLIGAANEAGVHELILRLPKGYETEIGDGGMMLSGGQKQRIALARALYGDPFLVVLDEPNSNLDAAGEQALIRAIGRIRARGGIVVLIAHRPTLLGAVDHMLVLNEGRMQAFGPTQSVLPLLTRTATPAEPEKKPRRMEAPVP